MSGDLLVITPSRGRPQHLARLLSTVHQLRRLRTHVHACVDDDDPELEEYKRVFSRHSAEGDTITIGSRLSVVQWVNGAALSQALRYRCLAYFGDDCVPRTRGFDQALVTACTENGPAIAYPWSGLREAVPEAPVVASEIVLALGWLLNPDLDHFHADDGLGALGRGAGCLRHLRAVAVDHLHPRGGTAPPDDTYREAERCVQPDRAAYEAWRAGRMPADVAVVAGVRQHALQLA